MSTAKVVQSLADFTVSRMIDNEYTKDLAILNNYKTQLLFVYGTLRHSFPRNNILVGNGGQFRCYAFTSRQDLDFKFSPSSQFPIAFSTNDEDRKGRVFGEVWEIPAHLMPILDRIEQNGKLFERRRISCLYAHSPDANGHQPVINDVWFYYGNNMRNASGFYKVEQRLSNLYGPWYGYSHMLSIKEFGGVIKT